MLVLPQLINSIVGLHPKSIVLLTDPLQGLVVLIDKCVGLGLPCVTDLAQFVFFLPVQLAKLFAAASTTVLIRRKLALQLLDRLALLLVLGL